MIPFLPKAPANLNIFNPEQEKFVKHFLPCAANSTRVSDNLKMSLIIEALLMNMWTSETLHPGKALTDAVKKGIKARHKKCEYNTKTKEDKKHQAQLVMSAERINLVLEMLEMADEPATSIGGLDGTDDMPESSLESDLSDLDLDITDPNDDTTMTVGHVDRASSPDPTPEASEESLVSERSASPDFEKARAWNDGTRKKKVLKLNTKTKGRRKL